MKIKLLTLKDLRAKKPAEIEAYISNLRKDQAELLHGISINKEKQTHQVGLVKRAIAQAKTVQVQTTKEKEK